MSITEYPSMIRDALGTILRSPSLNRGVKAMESRGMEASEERTMLIGAAMESGARDYLDSRLDDVANDGSVVPYESDEVVIGSGIHAAIYCIGRARAGFNKPVVIESGERYGGTFAMTSRPAFYLNSKNAPGLIGDPDKMQALNYLPGFPVQPSDISYREYQVNSDLGFLIRLALAKHAKVFTGAKAEVIYPDSYRPMVALSTGYDISARRIIDARGLGIRNMPATPNGTTVLSFEQFMQRADSMFPLQGMGRVAVIGGGDSGKVTVESLLGIGPNSGMSTASLDYVRSITWYAPTLPKYGRDWRNTQRRRYSRIGSYLPEDLDTPEYDEYGNRNETEYEDYVPGRAVGNTRLTILPERAEVLPSVDSVLVNGKTYDVVIQAAGLTVPTLGTTGYSYRPYGPESFRLGNKLDSSPVYQVGPVAGMDWSRAERQTTYAQNDNNKVGIFRLANRTAALAATLPYSD